MLVFAPFRASSGFKSRSWQQLRQRKSRSCRQEPVGENQGEKAPTSPSPAATEPGSRVAEHVRHGRKLEIKGEKRARARCHPNLLPKVREGGGEITPRHTRWHIRRIRHRSEVHRAVGPMELFFSACPGYNKDGLQHRQAKLNKKPTKSSRGAFLPVSSQSGGTHTNSLPMAGEAADAGRAPYVPVRQEQQCWRTPKSSFSHFWVFF